MMENGTLAEYKSRVQEGISFFLQQESLYEMLPLSGQVLVLEKNLSLLDVIEIFLSHVQEAALIWDPDTMNYIGVVTDRDLLNIMMSLYQDEIAEIEEARMLTILKSTTLHQWRTNSESVVFVYVSADDDLLNATRTLKDNHLHRVPIIDASKNLALGILSMEAVLRFFVDNYVGDETLFQIPVSELPIGVTNTVTAPDSISMLEALRIMWEHTLSSLPLLDNTQRLSCVLFLSDIPHIMRSNLYLTPSTSIISALQLVNHPEKELGTQRISILQETDTLATAVEKLAMSSERKLYQLKDGHVAKIVTESDLFGYFIS
jgi:5'-AMP-activated protein kinase regulatory gamma subunit